MTATQSGTTTWAIDGTHSSVEFSIRHMMVTNVKGHFSKVSGSVAMDNDDHAAAVSEATIEVASIATRDENRDNHLKSADFFDAATYPAITFKSTSAEKVSDERYRVHGNLTIRNVTLPVVLDTEYAGEVKDMYGKQRRSYSATTEINRKDFGLTWNGPLEGGGVAVSDKVKISLDIAVVQI